MGDPSGREYGSGVGTPDTLLMSTRTGFRLDPRMLWANGHSSGTVGRNLRRANRPQMYAARIEHPGVAWASTENTPFGIHLHTVRDTPFGGRHAGEEAIVGQAPVGLDIEGMDEHARAGIGNV